MSPSGRRHRPPDIEELRARFVAARRALRRELRRKRRLQSRLQADLARAEGAEAMRRQGEALKYSLDQVPTGAERVVLRLPWAPDEPVEVPLRRDLAPAANMARIFRRARALERARAQIQERLATATRRSAELAELAERAAAVDLEEAQSEEELIVLLKAISDAGVRVRSQQQTERISGDLRRRLGRHHRQLPEGVQRFTTARGREVLVGRSASGNDHLVTRLSRGRDAWMHLRDHRGAHVLLRAQNRHTPHESTDLKDCAMLAAHLSGISRGERVDVTWTEARHVRKGKALPAGAVYVAEARTLRIQVDGAVIDAFYARRQQN